MSEFFGDDQAPAPRFEDLVGEGKKYRDPDAAAKAILEKDSFIQRLQEEAAEARAELRARLSLEELADKVIQAPRAEHQPITPRQEPVSEEPQTKPEADLSDLIAQGIEEHDTKKSRSQNIETARQKVRELYGGEAETAVRKAANALGVSEKYLLEMSAISPEGFVKVLQANVSPSKDPVVPPHSSYQPDHGGHSTKNAKYYRDMRKNDPKRYFSRNVQSEMHKMAKELGQNFYA